MKHTKGPWKVDERVGCIAIYPADEKYNCLDMPHHNFVAYWHGYMDEEKTWQLHEKDLANARLIAAAPELLEALKDARQQLIALCSENDVPDSVNLAIAKAEGK